MVIQRRAAGLTKHTVAAEPVFKSKTPFSKRLETCVTLRGVATVETGLARGEEICQQFLEI